MKKRVAKKRQSHLPIYIALGVLIGSIFIALFTDLKRPSAATDHPKHRPLIRKDLPITKNITHLDLNRMRNKPQIRINKTYFELPKAEGPFKEWEDFEGLMTELQRMGMGEQGKPAYFITNQIYKREKKLAMENGFNALLSDYISVNRSVADVRDEGCLAKQYSAKLPTVSVVIPFYNEYFSVLIRTLYSIVRRSPKELLKEIIIVDDGSDREYLKQELDNFIAANFPPNLIQIVRQNERTGLITARLAGARKATAGDFGAAELPVEVLLINMIYKLMDQLPEFTGDITEPYPNPIMMGGLFAISREFFWHLGGYDEGLDIWGAEQYELSFKIWMCGGLLFDVPCSRVGHVFRGPMEMRPSPRDYNFVARNHKRVAEVWMDDYRHYFYERNPSVYDDLDAGDLTAQKALRETLQCKSFQWFLDEIAPDLLVNYPPREKESFAYGAIQSLAYPSYCLDTLNGGSNSLVGLFNCADNIKPIRINQNWILTNMREVKSEDSDLLPGLSTGINANAR
ncbi:hypothetical protein DOY81_013623 [Sarcophaga bullata]|nr:hypothetical protein DOY81_013623 [Sarcophaga bullata]